MDSLALRISAIALAGACGSVGRYLTVLAAARLLGERFAYGVLAVNVVGCLAIGMVMRACMAGDFPLSETARLAIVVGLLGGLTTFSSFGYDTLQYLEQQRWGVAATNVLSNVILGVAACAAGAWLAGAWLARS